jgi:hypothetical protein
MPIATNRIGIVIIVITGTDSQVGTTLGGARERLASAPNDKCRWLKLARECSTLAKWDSGKAARLKGGVIVDRMRGNESPKPDVLALS